ncbi:MAG TPA: hypothetical protein DFS52_19630 [Myxococcales bacterium]|nr:hypothetical protein [Myxococcales bacterium]
MAIDKNKIIEAATKYVQKGQYDKAIKEYNKLLDADPRDARIQQKLGELYQKKGENGLAADSFLKVAESYSADGFFLKAVAVYKQVLKLNPNLVDVNLKLAELHQQLGLMSDAMAQFQLVVEHYDKVGDSRASLDTLRKMVDLDPDNIASRIKLAELYAREAMNPEAIAEFQHAAEYLKRNNRVDDYIKVAERLVFLDPGNIELTRELAAIYLAKQDTKRALAKLQLCFKADPKDVETLHMLAQAFKELGQVSKTVSVYKELARIYDEQDRIDEERDVWRKISELAPNDPDARARLAPAQPAQAPAAVAAAAPAARGAPAATSGGSPEQISKLLTETDVYVKYGLHEKAIEHLKKVFALDPNSVDAHEKAVTLYTATGNRAAAQESLVIAVRLCIGNNDIDRARENLQTLCEKEPTHAEIPSFLEAVGGLAPIEEISEIEEDAILVEAGDDDIEVSPEPPQVDLSLDGAAIIVEADDVEESFIEAPPDDDDAALEAAAQALSEDEVIAEAIDEDELIAEPPPDDDLAISVAAEQDEDLVEAADDFEDFAEPLAEMPFDGEPLADAVDAQYDEPFDPEGVGYSDEAFGGDEDLDSHEEATRVAYLPAMLAAQSEVAAAQSAAPPAEWPNEEGNEDVTAVLPTLDPSSLPGEVLAEAAADEFSEFAEEPADFVFEPPADELAEPLAEELADPFAEEPLAEELANPFAEEPLAEELADPLAEEPLAEEFADPIAEELADPIAEEPLADEFADPAAEEPVGDELAEPFAAGPMSEEPAEPLNDGFGEAEDLTSVVDLQAAGAVTAGDGADVNGPGEVAEAQASSEELAHPVEPPMDAVESEAQEAAASAEPEPEAAADEQAGLEAEESAGQEEEEEEPAGDELDEAAFFVEQGELEEARDILETVLIAFPKSKRAQELMARLEAKERGEEEPAAEPAAPPAPAAEAAPPDIAFDLAKELANEDFGDLGIGDESVSEDFQYSVEDVFNEFKKGVEKIVRPEDVDTHYDLGIAYKEMGLIDDAIGEFEQALSAAIGKKKEVECYTMIGICRAERDEHAAAVEAYVKGVKAAAITPDAAKALHYEIGLSLEKMGDLRRALKHLSGVEKVDGNYREVQSVLERIRAQGATELADSEETTGPTAKPKNGAAGPLGRQTTARPLGRQTTGKPLGRQTTGKPVPLDRQTTEKPAPLDRQTTAKPQAPAGGEKSDGKPAPAKKSRNIGYV